MPLPYGRLAGCGCLFWWGWFRELRRIDRNVRMHLAQFDRRPPVRPRQSKAIGHLDTGDVPIFRVVYLRGDDPTGVSTYRTCRTNRPDSLSKNSFTRDLAAMVP